MKRIFLLLIVLLAFSEGSQASRKVELFDVVKLFTPDRTMNYNIYEWSTGTGRNSPIRWSSNGVEMDDNATTRRGFANISVSGKTYQCLGRYSGPCVWDVILSGCRNGYTKFSIYSVNHQEINPAIPINRLLGSGKYTIRLIKNLEYGRFYELLIPGKKKIWIIYSWSCGSSGCSISIDGFTNYEEATEEANSAY